MAVFEHHGFHHVEEQASFMRRQLAHHAAVDPDHFAAVLLALGALLFGKRRAHDHVGGMRIGVEKTRVHHLMHVGIRQTVADIAQVVAGFLQLVHMLERDAFDELHDEHRFVGIAGIDRGRRNAFLAAHTAGETQEIVTLYREVDFFAHRTVEFIDHGDDIDACQDRRTGQIQQVGSAAHELDVALHVFFDMVAPDLYRDRGAVFGEMRLVYLGDRGRPERLFVEIGEHAHAIVAIDRLEPFDHVFERLGRGGAAQRLQRVAVFLRKHIRA